MGCINKSEQANPLSPHLQIYKLPLNAWMSVANRLSGITLYFLLIITLWSATFYLLQGHETSMAGCMRRFFSGNLGKVFVAVGGLVLIFHCLNGIKYVIFDLFVGKLFNKGNGPALVVIGMALIFGTLFVLFITGAL